MSDDTGGGRGVDPQEQYYYDTQFSSEDCKVELIALDYNSGIEGTDYDPFNDFREVETDNDAKFSKDLSTPPPPKKDHKSKSNKSYRRDSKTTKRLGDNKKRGRDGRRLSSESIVFNNLEEEMKYCRKVIKVQTKKIQFLLAATNVLNQWIFTKFATNLFDKSSSYVSTVCNWDEVERISRELITSPAHGLKSRQTNLLQQKRKNTGSEEENAHLINKLGPQQDLTRRNRRESDNDQRKIANIEVENVSENSSAKHDRKCRGRKKYSPEWDLFHISRDETGRSISATCLRCKQFKIYTPRIQRLRQHLAKCEFPASVENLKASEDVTKSVCLNSVADLGTSTDFNIIDSRNIDSGVPIPGRKMSAEWELFDVARDEETGEALTAACINCNSFKICKPRIERLRLHLSKCEILTKGSNKSKHDSGDPRITNEEQELEGKNKIELKLEQMSPSPTVKPRRRVDRANANSGGRKKAPEWDLFNVVRDEKTGQALSAACPKCSFHTTSPRIERLRFHLARCGKKVNLQSILMGEHLRKSQTERENSLKHKMMASSKVRAHYNKNRLLKYGCGTIARKKIIRNPKSEYWSYFETERNEEGKIISNICLRCKTKVSPLVVRLKSHLINCGVIQPSNEIMTAKTKNGILLIRESIRKYFEVKQYAEEESQDHKASLNYPSFSSCKFCSTELISSTTPHLVQHLSICKPEIGQKYQEMLREKPEAFRPKIPKQCEECGKILIGSIEKHMLIHLNLKPLQCKECPKTFRASHQLKFHIQSVHKGVKFPKRKRIRKLCNKQEDGDQPVPF